MKRFIVAAIAAVLAGLAFSAPVQAQDASACNIGPYSWADVGRGAKDLLPSVEKQISALGLRAALQDCRLVVVCGQGAEKPMVARRTCEAFLGILQRANSLPESQLSFRLDEKMPFGAVNVRVNKMSGANAQ